LLDIDLLFDSLFEAADAMMKSCLPMQIGISWNPRIFKAPRRDAAQTRRMGMQTEGV
jgi:hypothetical protein